MKRDEVIGKITVFLRMWEGHTDHRGKAEEIMKMIEKEMILKEREPKDEKTNNDGGSTRQW